MSLALAEWVDVVCREYLDTFIPDGGAAVKFAVGLPGAPDPGGAVIQAAQARGFVTATVDGAVTRIDQMQALFAAVARQLSWHELAAAVRERGVAACGWTPPEDGSRTFEAIANRNGIAVPLVQDAFERWCSTYIYENYRMSADFRMAMMFLCLEPMRGHSQLSEPSVLEESIVEWLRGELRLISAVKRAQIYQKVARHNARDLFVSLGHWVRAAGKPGLAVTIDARALASATRAQTTPGTFFYGRPQIMDMYELFRQFIDSTDELESTFITVVLPPSFTEDDVRGMRAYRALENRVAEEVRDRVHDNPLAALVRIRAGALV